MSYKNIFSLSNKTIVLTGAAGFLGRYFASCLAEFGANLALIDLEPDHSKQWIESHADRYDSLIIGYSCDISSKAQTDYCIEQVKNDFGIIDGLINNAQGKTVPVQFEECRLEDWRLTSKVNEEGIFIITQAVGNIMIAQGAPGTIINMSSIYAILGPDMRIYDNSEFNGKPMGTRAVYSYTKSGLLGLTKYLATYWAKHNIRVNAITPGGVESLQNPTFKSQYSSRVPLGRMAIPDDLLGAIIFLSSNASSYITGQNFIIDGGLSSW